MLPAESAVENKHQFKELNPQGEHTIIVIGGANEGVANQAPFTEALAKEGFRVISFDYVTEPDPDNSVPNRYHSAKTQQLIDILDQQATDKPLTLFAHSEGTIMAVEATLQDPKKVERLILANPDGLFPDSFLRLTGRFAIETLRATTTLKREARSHQNEGIRHTLKHPRNFFGDAIDIARSDIRDRLLKLKNEGVKVDFLLSAKDMIFPWRLQKDYFEGQDPEQFDFNSVSMYNGTKPNGSQNKFAGQWAGHNQNNVYPEQAAQVVKQLVEQ